jgi:hypothetical protein
MREATPSLPKYAFMAWCRVKQRYNFTFTFILLTLPLTAILYFLIKRYITSSKAPRKRVDNSCSAGRKIPQHFWNAKHYRVHNSWPQIFIFAEGMFVQHPSLRTTTTFQLSWAIYFIHSQLPSISKSHLFHP